MNENKLKHLEFIQNIITRMNTNSFQIRALTVTIVSALIVLYVSSDILSLIIIALVPTTTFWFLDTYYLQQERKFRGIYDDVAGITKNAVVRPFEMPLENYVKGKYNYFVVFKSKTMGWFYIPIIVLLIITYITICFNNL